MFEGQRTSAEKLAEAKRHAEEYVSDVDKSLDAGRNDLSMIEQKIAEVTASIERIQEMTQKEQDVGQRARLDSTLLDKRSELLQWKQQLEQAELGLQKIGEYRDSGEAAIATTSEELKKRLN